MKRTFVASPLPFWMGKDVMESPTDVFDLSKEDSVSIMSLSDGDELKESEVQAKQVSEDSQEKELLTEQKEEASIEKEEEQDLNELQPNTPQKDVWSSLQLPEPPQVISPMLKDTVNYISQSATEYGYDESIKSAVETAKYYGLDKKVTSIYDTAKSYGKFFGLNPTPELTIANEEPVKPLRRKTSVFELFGIQVSPKKPCSVILCNICSCLSRKSSMFIACGMHSIHPCNSGLIT